MILFNEGKCLSAHISYHVLNVIVQALGGCLFLTKMAILLTMLGHLLIGPVPYRVGMGQHGEFGFHPDSSVLFCISLIISFHSYTRPMPIYGS